MLNPDKLESAVEISQRAYRLLRWVVGAIEQGYVTFDEVHKNVAPQAAAQRWITRFQAQFPPDTRPPEGQEQRFANYFASFLTTSFDLVEEPGRITRTDCGCLCPMCRYMVNAHHLQPKKLTKREKRRAEPLKREAVLQLANDMDIAINDQALESILEDAELRESLALLTYARELLRRCGGAGSGPEALALWRQFAWKPEGSPRKDFKLSAQMMLDAEARLADRLSTAAK